MLTRVGKSFFRVNTNLSLFLEKVFGWRDDKYFWAEFDTAVQAYLRKLDPGSVVADLGGGRRFIYSHWVPKDVKVWAIDIDPDELELNSDVDTKILGDVSKSLPIDSNEVDLILSRALLEHVEDNESALREMHRILKPGGRMIHFIPARYSTFGVAARVLPFEQLKKLLHLAIPGTIGIVEFPVFYNLCTAKKLSRNLEVLNFGDISVKTCYYASSYFYPVLPAYLVVVFYQFIIRKMKIDVLSQYLIVTAKK